MLDKYTPNVSSSCCPSLLSDELENSLFFTNLFPYVVSTFVKTILLSFCLNISLNFTVVPSLVLYSPSCPFLISTSEISKSYTISSASVPSPIPGTLIVLLLIASFKYC